MKKFRRSWGPPKRSGDPELSDRGAINLSKEDRVELADSIELAPASSRIAEGRAEGFDLRGARLKAPALPAARGRKPPPLALIGQALNPRDPLLEVFEQVDGDPLLGNLPRAAPHVAVPLDIADRCGHVEGVVPPRAELAEGLRVRVLVTRRPAPDRIAVGRKGAEGFVLRLRPLSVCVKIFTIGYDA